MVNLWNNSGVKWSICEIMTTARDSFWIVVLVEWDEIFGKWRCSNQGNCSYWFLTCRYLQETQTTALAHLLWLCGPLPCGRCVRKCKETSVNNMSCSLHEPYILEVQSGHHNRQASVEYTVKCGPVLCSTPRRGVHSREHISSMLGRSGYGRQFSTKDGGSLCPCLPCKKYFHADNVSEQSKDRKLLLCHQGGRDWERRKTWESGGSGVFEAQFKRAEQQLAMNKGAEREPIRKPEL